jgi:hypothetical protein
MTEMLIKLAVRFALFGLVFGFAVWRNPKVRIRPKLALPLIALVFAILNTGLYWLARPILNVATFGAMWLFLPFVLNGLFLWATQRVLRPLRIDGMFTMAWLAILLTAAHGVAWLVLDNLAFGG